MSDPVEKTVGKRTESAKRAPEWWEPLWELVIHVLVGSLLFAVIFAPAIGLEFLVRWLVESLQVSETLSRILTFTKYAVAAIDAVLYILFMVKMGWDFVRKLFWGLPHHE
ncbi:MAG TPA: hypothetical protein VGP68_14005 [Gemmataceae bacterium]|nr:hypothetical protein [Gemmataceae bacterium]